MLTVPQTSKKHTEKSVFADLIDRIIFVPISRKGDFGLRLTYH